jgi:hypothetical protein
MSNFGIWNAIYNPANGNGKSSKRWLDFESISRSFNLLLMQFILAKKLLFYHSKLRTTHHQKKE